MPHAALDPTPDREADPTPDAPAHASADRDAHPGPASGKQADPARLADQQASALTLDMGGRVGDALAIVDWLVDHEVHATIFMTGAMADNPNTDAGRQVLASSTPIPVCSRSATTRTRTLTSGA